MTNPARERIGFRTSNVGLASHRGEFPAKYFAQPTQQWSDLSELICHWLTFAAEELRNELPFP